MSHYYHITILSVSEEEKLTFASAGVAFSQIVRGEKGESVSFDLGQDDPRWQRVNEIIANLDGRAGLSKEHRVQRLSMTAPSWEESMRQAREQIRATQSSRHRSAWLSHYSGQSVDELLALGNTHRIDSVVLAFEEAISQKSMRHETQALTEEETIVLAVEALEREVNNGGYHQFFVNSSKEFAPVIVDALERIGCTNTAAITKDAMDILEVKDLTASAIDRSIHELNTERRMELSHCDQCYYANAEPIAERLFAFIKANKSGIQF